MGRVRPQDPLEPKGPVMEALAWILRRRPVTWLLVNVGTKIDPVLMRLSGGRVRTTLNAPTVLLTHTGRRSGKRRQTPLAYFSDGEDVILIASRGGHQNHPAWLYNLRANPEVELWTTGGGGRYRAREASWKQRDRLWKLATEFYAGFGDYQERAGDRLISVVVCTPLED